MKPKYTIIISVDALNRLDLPFIQTLPNFKLLMSQGSYVKSVHSIYPSLTYCSHTSIITGTYPDKHGIYNNELYNPPKALVQNWFWYKKDIQVPTLFDYAKAAKLKTAMILWPVMAGAKWTYNVPEIWEEGSGGSFPLFWKYGTKSLAPTLIKNSKLLQGKKQPYLDNFTEAMALDVLRKKPHLLALHLIEVDQDRHEQGFESIVLEETLRRMDTRIGRIIDETKQLGIYDETAFIVLGDHGSANFHHHILINSLFKQEGLLTTDTQNKITTWQAYACNAGGSVQIHVKDPENKELMSQVDLVLGMLTVMPHSPIKAILTKEEARLKYHLEGPFQYVLEANPGYVFRNHVTDDLLEDTQNIPGVYKADHGFAPENPQMQTLFMAMGPGVRKGQVLDSACLVDEGPTIAKIMGLEMTGCDGRILTEMLTE